ncbi:leucine-rich repeat-containing protein 34-like isoform X1 [Tribolium madens]|uniref:leucine-rich repeat-containing protein 34-like isoform X1 n=2 Tax=Tribolium madens TaxID=41895 RepID=UPI001CF74808|nr:leucine-rich repeat-containing protein 34-like isoform X1 [Tribolium madens]
MSKMWEYSKLWGLRFTETFLQLFSEKNSDGTKKLRFKANELEQRFAEQLLPADMVYISTFLNAHPEVVDVDLSYNGIEDEGLETLCNITLAHQNNLQHLNLSHCDITPVGMKVLYFTAEQHGFVKLKTLRLTGNKLGPTGGHLAALFAPYCPTLEYLDLGDTDQTADSVDCIFLQLYRSQIKILDISRVIPCNNMSQVNNVFLSESISELIRLNQTIVEIHAQKSSLDAHDIESLILGLKLNTSLKFLDIGYNNICCVGVEFLSEWLKTRPPLLGLCIAGNNIKNHGGVALSFGMPFSKLRYLDISYNYIGNEGIIAILNSIKKPYMLRYFLLWGNSFSHPANKIIQRMMLSTVFEQRGIDVKIYEVDGVLYAARYPVDKYKQQYYGVMDYGCAVELKIKKNKIETRDDKPRALVNFVHIDRYPEIEKKPKQVQVSEEKERKVKICEDEVE